MKHRVWFDEDHNALRVRLVGHCDRKDIVELGKKFRELLGDKRSRRGVIDLSEIDSFPDEDTRKQLVDETSAVGFTKVAVVGTRPEIKVVGLIIFERLGKEVETEFFNEETKAIIWLNGD